MKTTEEITFTTTKFPKLTIRINGDVSIKFPIGIRADEQKRITTFFRDVTVRATKIGFSHTLRGTLYMNVIRLEPYGFEFDLPALL